MPSVTDKPRSLSVKGALLNTKFEGYKINFHPREEQQIELPSNVYTYTGDADTATHTNTHTVAFYRDVELWNNLYRNPWVEDAVYYFDYAGGLQQVLAKANGEQCRLTTLTHHVREPEAIARSSLMFVSANIAVYTLTDACVYVCFLQNGGEAVVSTISIPASDASASIRVVDALLIDTVLRVVVQEMTTEKTEPAATSDTTVRSSTSSSYGLRIATLAVDVANRTCSARALSAIIKGSKRPDYVAMTADATGLLVVCEEQLSSASTATLANDTVDAMEEEDLDPPTPYVWTQTDDSVSLSFKVPEGTQTTQINVDIKSKAIIASIGGDFLPGFGDMYAPVDVDSCVWTREGNVVDVHLEKAQHTGNRWVYVFEDDQTAETMDPSKMRGMLDAMEKYMQQTKTPGMGGGLERVAGLDQMEEVDFDDGPILSVYKYTIAESTPTITISPQPTSTTALGGSQWQFPVLPIEPSYRPAFALKTNVDIAIFTQEKDVNSTPFSHTVTFDALAYVLASKRNLKLKSVPTDTSYAAACDCFSQVYIYNKPSEPGGTKADQSIFTLPTTDRIVGLQALPKAIVVLTDKAIYIQWL
ncbi:hypothetical protein SARC_09746 [Sphaeroforma arctica JP610]|uniref:NudC domain-containing protein 1 n=1 Tax=Sphaeroforma arctica JP610 TaxID=667725 RepID=A0A0L0FM02_9EUKA|nr:hypothetical protein SARC_09746 [Sphaeroforma arctica JP610]KNC77807.1 hypothetical protein SARC_09746 [Sphaeroforma arctica JP610]|eukprot:XP_014151709.1 hypothetical protein SARC_09746 [Sphaeroforma arctica JP610]